MKFKAFVSYFIQSYIPVLFLALIAGIYYGDTTVSLARYSTWFLAGIFFLTALKVDLKEFLNYGKDVKMIILQNVTRLIILPAAVYYVTDAIYPPLALPFLILAAMPSGMTSPLVAEICGGKQSLALVFAITTSLLAPFTVPFVIKVFAGSQIAVSFMSMFLSLAKVIFVPFILANIIKRVWQNKIKSIYPAFTPISIILLGLLIAGIVAKQSDHILSGSGGMFWSYILALSILFVVFHVVGYSIIFWRSTSDRITIAVTMAYFNFTLAVYLVGKFFNEPNIAIPVILSVLPWSIMIIPFKMIVKRSGALNSRVI